QAQALPKSFQSAIMMQKAVAIGILLVAPVRLKNLVMLDRSVHFRRALTAKGDGWELCLAAATVKNDIDLHLPLPSWLMAEGEINELHVGLKGTMNAIFLKDLASKTRRGLEGRIRQGRSGGGNAYGYE